MLSVVPILASGVFSSCWGLVIFAEDMERAESSGRGTQELRPTFIERAQCRQKARAIIQGNQHHHGDLQGFHAMTAGLLDQQVVNVAHGLQLAANRLLPAAQVESSVEVRSKTLER